MNELLTVNNWNCWFSTVNLPKNNRAIEWENEPTTLYCTSLILLCNLKVLMKTKVYVYYEKHFNKYIYIYIISNNGGSRYKLAITKKGYKCFLNIATPLETTLKVGFHSFFLQKEQELERGIKYQISFILQVEKSRIELITFSFFCLSAN